jgi:hypothetical protein
LCSNKRYYVVLVPDHPAIFAARIDDGDEDFLDEDWQRESGINAVKYPLRADRWWSVPGKLEEDADGRCMGIRCNIYARALKRMYQMHKLRGGGNNNIGWGALRWQDLIGASEVRFGKHREIRYLPKKIANFLHEYRADEFPSLNLPNLPSDRSRIDVHATLTPMHIAALLRRLQVY